MGLTGGSGDYAVAYGHLGATVNLSRHCEDCRCEKCRCEDCRCEALTPPRTTSSHSTPPHPTSPHTRPIQSSLAHRHCPVPLACHFPRSWLAHTVHCTTTRVLTDPYQLPDAPPSIPAFPTPPPPPRSTDAPPLYPPFALPLYDGQPTDVPLCSPRRQYGYDSILGYNPKLDLAVAVASNIETPEQLQPSDAFCGVFNRAKNFLNGEKVQTCTFSASGYYGGKCSCK